MDKILSIISLFKIHRNNIIMLSLFVVYSSALSAAENLQIYKEELNELPTLKKGNSRLVFYGTNYLWNGLIRGDWRPKITIDGQDLNAPNSRNVYFVVDVPVGTHEIGVKYHKKYIPIVNRAPKYYYNTQGYTLDAVDGQTYYHEMSTSRIFLENSTFVEFFLSLWQVEAEYAPQRLKRMTHWLKEKIEERKNDEEEE